MPSVNVTLTIHNLISGDAGNYICRAGAADAQATTTPELGQHVLPWNCHALYSTDKNIVSATVS